MPYLSLPSQTRKKHIRKRNIRLRRFIKEYNWIEGWTSLCFSRNPCCGAKLQAVEDKGVLQDDEVWLKLCYEKWGWGEECTDSGGSLSLQSSGSWRRAPSSDNGSSIIVEIDERQVDFREHRIAFALSCTVKLCEHYQ
jgi:hypothetical protein